MGSAPKPDHRYQDRACRGAATQAGTPSAPRRLLSSSTHSCRGSRQHSLKLWAGGGGRRTKPPAHLHLQNKTRPQGAAPPALGATHSRQLPSSRDLVCTGRGKAEKLWGLQHGEGAPSLQEPWAAQQYCPCPFWGSEGDQEENTAASLPSMSCRSHGALHGGQREQAHRDPCAGHFADQPTRLCHPWDATVAQEQPSQRWPRRGLWEPPRSQHYAWIQLPLLCTWHQERCCRLSLWLVTWGGLFPSTCPIPL